MGQLASKDHVEQWEIEAMLEQWVRMGQLVLQDSPDTLDCKDPRVSLGLLVILGLLEKLDSLERVDLLVLLDYQEQRVALEQRVCQEQLEQQEHLVDLEVLEPPEQLELPVRLEKLAQLDLQEHQAQWEIPVRSVPLELVDQVVVKVCLEQQAIQVVLASLEHLDQMVRWAVLGLQDQLVHKAQWVNKEQME